MNQHDPPKKKKRTRKPRVEWKYEVVQAEGEVDMEGLAYLLAQMFMKSKYYLNPTFENIPSSSDEKKPEEK